MNLKSFVRAASVVAALLLAHAAHADHVPLPMVGIGVALPLGGVPGGTIQVPLNVTGNIRVEPSIGLIKTGTESKGTKTDTETNSAITAGLGAFYFVRPDENYLVYVGPRFAVAMHTTEKTKDDAAVTSTTTRTDILAGLAVGGEHFFGPRFSLGGEVALGMAMIGESKTVTNPATPAPATPAPVVTTGVMSTAQSVYARFYW